MSRPERKYQLTRVKAGDYLLPSNDGKVIWRIAKYTDGPSNGLDIPCDREFWGVWRWSGRVDRGVYVDTGGWDRWEFHAGMHDTRQLAISAALGVLFARPGVSAHGEPSPATHDSEEDSR